MKKIFRLSVILIFGGFLVACKNEEKTTATPEPTKESESFSSTSEKEFSTEQVIDTTNPESVDFTVKGTYKVGEDIEPGNYYVVLTELEHRDDDTNKLTEIHVNISDSSDKHVDNVYFSQIGDKERVNLEKGMSFKIIDNGIEFNDFTLKFLTDDDYKKYSKENK